jgi:thymidylate synthase
MPNHLEDLQRFTKATQPWAENHFKERVGKLPLNPGNEYKNWPFYREDKKFRNVGEQFTHTYMERYWPRLAGKKQANYEGFEGEPNKGIRYEYGDLDDVIRLLGFEPNTRQAYLPVWFPEDTGVLHGGRVPCSIGYHFQMRNHQLDIAYTMRASEGLRHFRNDIYLTVRLGQWVLEQLTHHCPDVWQHVTMGVLTMHVVNFHVFKQEINLI